MKNYFYPFFLLFFLISSLYADILYKEDGTKIEGKFLKLEKGKYKFQKKDGTIVSLPMSDVLDIEIDDEESKKFDEEENFRNEKDELLEEQEGQEEQEQKKQQKNSEQTKTKRRKKLKSSSSQWAIFEMDLGVASATLKRVEEVEDVEDPSAFAYLARVYIGGKINRNLFKLGFGLFRQDATEVELESKSKFKYDYSYSFVELAYNYYLSESFYLGLAISQIQEGSYNIETSFISEEDPNAHALEMLLNEKIEYDIGRDGLGYRLLVGYQKSLSSSYSLGLNVFYGVNPITITLKTEEETEAIKIKHEYYGMGFSFLFH